MCLLVWHSGVRASDEVFYRHVADRIRAAPGAVVIWEDPSLVDTNNVKPILNPSKVERIKIAPEFEVAGVRLGMKMDDVVGVWGKPRAIVLPMYRCWLIATNREAGPRLEYSDVTSSDIAVDFESTSNSVMAITVTFPQIGNRASARPKAEECLRVFGEPSLRSIAPDPFLNQTNRAVRYDCLMVYDMSAGSTALVFRGGELVTVEANRYIKSADIRRP